MNAAEKKLTHWMAENGITCLRVSIGVVFLWFGFIKYFPGLSPIEGLALRTVKVLTFNLFSSHAMAFGLATLECLIGLGLITGSFLRITLFLLFLQLIGAISPLFIFPAEVFKIFPIVFTFAGQYIVKDIILISAGILIGGTVRGGKLISDPAIAERAKKAEDKKLEMENNAPEKKYP